MSTRFRALLFTAATVAAFGAFVVPSMAQTQTARLAPGAALPSITSAAQAASAVNAMFAAAQARYNAAATDADRAAIANGLAQQVAALILANPQYALAIASAVVSQPNGPLRTATLTVANAAASLADGGGRGTAAATFLSNLSAGVQAGSAPSGGGSGGRVLSPS